MFAPLCGTLCLIMRQTILRSCAEMRNIFANFPVMNPALNGSVLNDRSDLLELMGLLLIPY